MRRAGCLVLLALTGCGRVAFDALSGDGGTDGIAIGASAMDRISRPGIDAAGNIYLSGTYRAPLTIGETTYPLGGTSATYVASFAPDFAPRWVTTYSSSEVTEGSRFAVASDGTSYVGGYYAGTLALPDRTVDSGAGQNAIAIAHDATGAYRWAREYGGDWNFQLQTIAIAPDESRIATGGLYLSTTPSMWGALQLPGTFVDNGYVLELDAAGTETWVRRLRSGGSAWASAVRYRDDGRLCRAGVFEVDLDYDDNGSVDATALGGADSHLGLATSSGATVWTSTLGSPQSDQLYDTAASGDDCVFVGRADGAVELGGAASGALVVRYRADGTRAWATSLGGDSTAFMVTARADGTLLASGTFRGTWSPMGNPIDSVDGTRDGFVAELSADGTVTNLWLIAGPGEQTVVGFVEDGDDLIVTGVFDGAIETDSGELTPASAPSSYVVRITR